MSRRILSLYVLCAICVLTGAALTYALHPRIVTVVEDHTVTLTYCPNNQSYNSGDGHNGYGWTPR